jgi:hypothetical protein
MDEIIYIARVDGRPWAASGVKSKSVVPFVIFFASMETTRYLFNSHTQIPEFEKYFVIALAAVLIIFLQDLGVARWRTAYTTKFIHDVFFTALISTALFNVVAAFLPSFWVVYLDPTGLMPDWQLRVAVSLVMSAVGVTYVVARTHFHRIGEYHHLHARPSAHLFQRFRARENACLAWVYLADYILTSALISYLLVKAA